MEQNRRGWGPISLGFAASVLMMVGSYGVGWLTPAAKLARLPLITPLRDSGALQVIAAFTLTIGALLLVWAWIMLGAAVRRGLPMPALFKAALLWGIPLCFTLPLFSRDMFAYIGQGMLANSGTSPYTGAVADMLGWYQVGVHNMWQDTPAPYGPLFIWLEQVVMMATGGTLPEISILGFRLLALVGYLLFVFYGLKLAKHYGTNVSLAAWLIMVNPLTLFNFIAAGHNDSLMMGFLFMGLYLAATGKFIPAVLLVTASAGVKPISVIALPVIGLMWAGSGARWPRIIRHWLYTGAIFLVTLGGLGLVLGLGFDWIYALRSPVTITSWFAPGNLLAELSGGFVGLFGIPTGGLEDAIRSIVLVTGMAIAVYFMVTRRPIEPAQRLTLAFLAIVLFSPVIHPWYMLWCVSLIAVTGLPKEITSRISARNLTRTLVVTSVFGACLSIAEPMDMNTIINGSDFPRAPLGLLTMVGGAAIVTIYLMATSKKRTKTLQSVTIDSDGVH